MKEIDLNEILHEHADSYKDEDGNRCYYEWQILDVMKIAVNQAIDLCAANADADYYIKNNIFNSDDIEVYVINNSILDVKKLIK